MIPAPQPPVEPVNVPSGPQWNAVKHGLYSAAILLPGDDLAEFHRRRLATYRDNRPQTQEEADCVEAIVEYRWQLQRTRPWQAKFDGQVEGMAVDAAGRVTEPLAHKRLHSAMDVHVHRARIERSLGRESARLRELQKYRRMGFIEGAAKLPEGCYLDVSGVVCGLAAAPVTAPQAFAAVCQVAEQASAGPSISPVIGSNEERTGFSPERKEMPAATATPGTPATRPPPRRPLLKPDRRGRLIGIAGTRRLFLDWPKAVPGKAAAREDAVALGGEVGSSQRVENSGMSMISHHGENPLSQLDRLGCL